MAAVESPVVGWRSTHKKARKSGLFFVRLLGGVYCPKVNSWVLPPVATVLTVLVFSLAKRNR